MGKNETTQPIAQVTPETLQPVRSPSTHSDVDVPFQQAIIIGILVSAPLLVGLYGLGLRLAPLQWLAGWFVLFCAVTLAAFFWRMGIVTEALHRVEQWTGVDIEGDGSVGAHAAGVGQAPGERDPVDRMRKLTQPFIRTCFEQGREGRAATQPKLREAGFTDEEIEALRDALVRQGIAAWVNAGNHKSGLRLLVDYQKAQRLGEKIVWLPNGKAWQE